MAGYVPCRVDARWLGLVQTWHLATMVESHNQSADAERSDTTSLRVSLLNTCHVLCDVIDGNGVFEVESVRLGFQTCLVDKDSGVGVQSGEGEADVGVNETDFGRGNSSILQLHGGTLLASQDNDVLALDAYGACSCNGVISLVVRAGNFHKTVAPLLTASPAYSTWKTCPSGLHCVSVEGPWGWSEVQCEPEH